MLVEYPGNSLQFFRESFKILSRGFRRAIAMCLLSRGFRQTASGVLRSGSSPFPAAAVYDQGARGFDEYVMAAIRQPSGSLTSCQVSLPWFSSFPSIMNSKSKYAAAMVPSL
jgi:hypothetical protein